MRNSVLNMSQWETRVSECFSLIIYSRLTHAQSLERIDKHIHTELNRRTKTRAVYTSYVHGYVQGLITAHRQRIWQNEVEYCYLYEGVLYTTSHKETSKPLQGKPKTNTKDGGLFLNCPGGHYWIGTDKPY